MKNNFKRILAIVGVVLLLGAFCMPMFFAGGNSQGGFIAAMGAAVFVPVIAYAMFMVYRLIDQRRPRTEREIENIVFDVGNVLVDFDWKTYLDGFGFPKEKYEAIADATFRNPQWNERDRGLYEEEEYVKKFVACAPQYEGDIREVARRSPETISSLDYAETWVKYLKNQGYNLYILSNYGSYMLDATRPMMSFLKYMDGVVFSCDVGQIKPEPEIYQTLITRYNLEPSRSVFIDDRAENCNGARKAGLHAIQFKDLKQATAELEKLGVK